MTESEIRYKTRELMKARVLAGGGSITRAVELDYELSAEELVIEYRMANALGRIANTLEEILVLMQGKFHG